MSKTTHTPGPWYVKEREHTFRVFAKEHPDSICVIYAEPCRYGGKKSQTVTANAHLIGAAPEMLDVLKWMLNEMTRKDLETYCQTTIAMIRDVIAKAEGGAA